MSLNFGYEYLSQQIAVSLFLKIYFSLLYHSYPTFQVFQRIYLNRFSSFLTVLSVAFFLYRICRHYHEADRPSVVLFIQSYCQLSADLHSAQTLLFDLCSEYRLCLFSGREEHLASPSV